jgi:hypothetical protein
MPTLLEIGSEIQNLEALVLERDGDITDIEEEIDAWFEAAHDKRDQKLDAYAGLISELESRALVRQNEASRLSHRAKVDANKARFLKDRLTAFFDLAGLKTIETKRYRLTLASNGGKEPLSIHVPADMLPEYFRTVSTKIAPDREAIRDHIERKGELRGPDGRLLAEITERSKHMRIS